MNILIACEESQAITIEMRKRGHNCFSADLQECSGGHPEWHINGDCLPLLNGNCEFVTQDGAKHRIEGRWGMIIAHPPCTYLTVSGNRWFNKAKYGESAEARERERERAVEFFMEFVNCDCDRVAIENPIGVIPNYYREADQIIQPWWFGDNDVKSTCLWLKNLPLLQQEVFEKPEIQYKEFISKDGKHKRQSISFFNTAFLNTEERRRLRSKTFSGIAKAIAEQWGDETRLPEKQLTFSEVFNW